MPSTESSAVSYVVSPMARAQLDIQAVIAKDGLAAVLSNNSARTYGRLRAGFQIRNFNDTASTEGLTSWSRRLLSTPCSRANSILVILQLQSAYFGMHMAVNARCCMEVPDHMACWSLCFGLRHLCFRACGLSASLPVMVCLHFSVTSGIYAASFCPERCPPQDLFAACRPASLGPDPASPAWRRQLCCPRPSLPPHCRPQPCPSAT